MQYAKSKSNIVRIMDGTFYSHASSAKRQAEDEDTGGDAKRMKEIDMIVDEEDDEGFVI